MLLPFGPDGVQVSRRHGYAADRGGGPGAGDTGDGMGGPRGFGLPLDKGRQLSYITNSQCPCHGTSASLPCSSIVRNTNVDQQFTTQLGGWEIDQRAFVAYKAILITISNLSLSLETSCLNSYNRLIRTIHNYHGWGTYCGWAGHRPLWCVLDVYCPRLTNAHLLKAHEINGPGSS